MVEVHTNIHCGSLRGASDQPNNEGVLLPFSSSSSGRSPVKDVLAVSSGGSRLLWPHQYINNVANLGCGATVIVQHLQSASENITLL